MDVTRLKSLGAGARTFAGFEHAESIQISGLSRSARRTRLWRGVLARNFCKVSAARDRRDYSARQISQKSLTPGIGQVDDPPAKCIRRGGG